MSTVIASLIVQGVNPKTSKRGNEYLALKGRDASGAILSVLVFDALLQQAVQALQEGDVVVVVGELARPNTWIYNDKPYANVVTIAQYILPVNGSAPTVVDEEVDVVGEPQTPAQEASDEPEDEPFW